MEYHLPIRPEKPREFIWVEGYTIENKTAFESSAEDVGKGKMILNLAFVSEDYSPQKYDLFMKKFLKFLITEGYMSDFEMEDKQ